MHGERGRSTESPYGGANCLAYVKDCSGGKTRRVGARNDGRAETAGNAIPLGCQCGTPEFTPMPWDKLPNCLSPASWQLAAQLGLLALSVPAGRKSSAPAPARAPGPPGRCRRSTARAAPGSTQPTGCVCSNYIPSRKPGPMRPPPRRHDASSSMSPLCPNGRCGSSPRPPLGRRARSVAA